MTTARGSYFSTHHSVLLTEPSRALTGRPSAPLIESGSAKKRAVEQDRGVAQQQRAGSRREVWCPRMRTITGLDELKAAEGETLGTSEWHEVTQKDVDAFADVTGDHQWIHVDPERAKDTPFGGTIAHGYYTLSLAPRFNDQIFKLDGFAFALNYGLDRSASRRRCRSAARCARARSSRRSTDIPGGAPGASFEVTFEREGGEKPVCVAETARRASTRANATRDDRPRVAPDDDAVGPARVGGDHA